MVSEQARPGEGRVTAEPTFRQRLGVVALVLAIAAAILTPVDAEGAEPGLGYDATYAVMAEAFGPGPLAHSFTRVARCESEWKPWARAAGWDRIWGWYEYRGLLQVDPALHQWRADQLFWPGASLYSPRVNAHVAADVFAEQGWRAWPYCRRFA